MLFLIEYSREQGQLVRLDAFPMPRRAEAENARLELELALNTRGVVHEVVILEAASEEALRRTHRRYFDDVSAIARAGQAAA